MMLRTLFLSIFMVATAVAFSTNQSPLFQSSSTTRHARPTSLLIRQVVAGNSQGKGYTPKWTKKKTLADEAGDINSLGFDNVGLKGNIPVVFKQGNDTRTSMAWAGQPIRDVASQAGQYIQYGCGKGECGTCECMMNGKWVRPCIETVPASAAEAGELVLQIKAVKAKSTSSGTFFSIKSFFMGFWNNLLGMIGFVKFRKAARKNWEERKSYEDLVLQKTMEKKLARARKEQQNENNGNNNLSPGMA